MKYKNKKTGEEVAAEQFSPDNIIARAVNVTAQNQEGAKIIMNAGDWAVKSGKRIYVVREETFKELYEVIYE